VFTDGAPTVPVKLINCPGAPEVGKLGLKFVSAADTGAAITTAAKRPAIEASENIRKIFLNLTNTSQVNHVDFSCSKE
jgi:hypothetical protein